MLDPGTIEEFLAQRRIAVVGVSARSGHFGNVVLRELRGHGYDAVGVSPTAGEVEGQSCYADLASVPGPLDGVVVMVNADAAVGVVEEAARLGVPRVWLFKGLGARGAYSEEAAAHCREHGMAVVEGACPLMFLEPVPWFHRIHRVVRHANGSLPRAS